MPQALTTLPDMVQIPDQWKDRDRVWYAIVDGAEPVIPCRIRTITYHVETEDITLGVEDLLHQRRHHHIKPGDLHPGPDEAIATIVERIRNQLRDAGKPGGGAGS